MPVIWSRQGSFEISMKHWLYQCEHIFFFVETINDYTKAAQPIKIGDIVNTTWNPWNAYQRAKNGSYQWIFDPYLANPTLYGNNEAEITHYSPFQTPHDKPYWIVPLNKFINKTLLDPNNVFWRSDDSAFGHVPLVGNLNLWDKISAMFIYLYIYHKQDCDWVIKLDDDAILNIPATKAFLSFYNHSNSHYLGRASTRRMKFLKQEIVYNGGESYILSQNALKNMVLHSLLRMEYSDIDPNNYYAMVAFEKNLKCIRSQLTIEDVLTAVCLRNVGIIPEYSNDKGGTPRYPTRLTAKNYRNKSTLTEAIAWMKRYKPTSPFSNFLVFHPIKSQVCLSEYESMVQSVAKYMHSNKSESDWNDFEIRKKFVNLNDKPCPFICDWQQRQSDKFTEYIEKTLNCGFC